MQAVKLLVTGAQEGLNDLRQFRISAKELTLLSEIGLDQIPTATSFVDFASNRYTVSASGIWYTLKKLKKWGIVDFMEKGEGYKPLALTARGITLLRKQGSASAAPVGHKGNRVIMNNAIIARA